METQMYRNLLRRAHRAHYVTQSQCDVSMILPVKIDEVALCFRRSEDLDSFLIHADRDKAVEHFNSVPVDNMRRQDQSESFDVRFEFLRIRGADWRIECMCVLSGVAPLHERILLDRGSGAVIHASYKLPDIDAYRREISSGGRLGQHDGVMDAAYANTYGCFSYWRFAGLGHTYLKPRVNLRDATLTHPMSS